MSSTCPLCARPMLGPGHTEMSEVEVLPSEVPSLPTHTQ